MTQAYSDPRRESDLHALPDIEVFFDGPDISPAYPTATLSVHSRRRRRPWPTLARPMTSTSWSCPNG